jgi:hypothetical protein
MPAIHVEYRVFLPVKQMTISFERKESFFSETEIISRLELFPLDGLLTLLVLKFLSKTGIIGAVGFRLKISVCAELNCCM